MKFNQYNNLARIECILKTDEEIIYERLLRYKVCRATLAGMSQIMMVRILHDGFDGISFGHCYS